MDAPVVLFYLWYSFTSRALSICWFPAFLASCCLTALINTSNSLTLFSWKEMAKLQLKVLLKVTPVYLSSIISKLHQHVRLLANLTFNTVADTYIVTWHSSGYILDCSIFLGQWTAMARAPKPGYLVQLLLLLLSPNLKCYHVCMSVQVMSNNF